MIFALTMVYGFLASVCGVGIGVVSWALLRLKHGNKKLVGTDFGDDR